ncbi:MAG: hypothetical protein JWO38_6869 [Gemmataceae bacterium]|nr:hypothetical protein [Gemmataceae bacterium]
MSQPYDATAKELLETDPAGWAAFLGVTRPTHRVRVVDSDLATITAATDRVLRIEDVPPWLLHVEFQSAWDGWLPRRLLMYNALLGEKHRLPVASVVVLLAPRAEAAALTGRYPVAPPFGPAWEFGYTVVRVWELPAERMLGGPLAVVPLAPVAAVTPAEVPDIIARAGQRIRREADADTGDRLMTAIGFLLQLRYGDMTAEELIRKVPDVRDFGPFRTFLEEGRAEGRALGQAEGRAEGVRQSILALGRKKFGVPTPEQEAVVNALADLAQLESLREKLLDVTTWDELLKTS